MEINKFKENSKINFNKQAKTYDEKGDGKFVAPMYEEIVTRVIKAEPERVLDLGCGTGNVLMRLAEHKGLSLHGLDLSENMIEVAKQNLSEEIELKVGDSENIPWQDNYFDVIVCNASFHHYPNPEKVLLEIKRVLKSHGTLILGDPTAPIIWRQIINLYCRTFNTGDYRIYSRKEIEELLIKCGFEVFDFKMINHKSFAINGRNRG